METHLKTSMTSLTGTTLPSTGQDRKSTGHAGGYQAGRLQDAWHMYWTSSRKASIPSRQDQLGEQQAGQTLTPPSSARAYYLASIYPAGCNIADAWSDLDKRLEDEIRRMAAGGEQESPEMSGLANLPARLGGLSILSHKDCAPP